MMDVIYNNKGIPLVAFGKGILMTTSGGPQNKMDETKTIEVKPSEKYEKTTNAAGMKVYSWGSLNKFPEDALTLIEKNTVLSSGLKYKLQLLLGQGIFPCRISGYKPNGDELYEVVDDPNVVNIMRSRMIRTYLSNSARDIFKLGMAFPVLQFNATGDKIVSIITMNARSVRWEYSTNGRIQWAWIGDWREPKDFVKVRVLDIENPDLDMDILIEGKKTKSLNVIYPLKNYFGNNYYYQSPDWYTAYNAGWMDISSSVPAFLKTIYTNQVTLKWHIKIPYVYWEKRYPRTQYKDVKERQALITAEMDKIENNITGTDNAHKALITHFEINSAGKPEEKWEIEAIDNKYKTDYQMIESAVADSNILFSINVNPTVMGAGLPGAGPYAGKTGGSDIRESFLVNVALTWLDRQNILDPLEMMMSVNGIKDVELRFRNTILTTLDTGGGTDKIVS